MCQESLVVVSQLAIPITPSSALRHCANMAKEVATREFCKSLPKVELHAHLNGSCRNSTLHELANGNTEITHDSAHLLSETGTFSAPYEWERSTFPWFGPEVFSLVQRKAYR